jgi:N-acetylneuraminate synthase/sialic acid synthase
MNDKIMNLGKFVISEDSPCFVIAEIGHNHQGNLYIAKRMIDAVAKAGANAVKLQKRSTDLLTVEAGNKPYDNENSFGKTYAEHRAALEFGEPEYKELKKYAEDLGLVFFATPFDIKSVDFLERIGVSAYKIASACITDIPLIEHVAKKGKPIFLSLGTATIEDVDRAYNCIRNYNVPMCLLHCVAAYPMMDYGEANLNVIVTLKERYTDALIGFSSHESGIVLPIAAYMLGARVIEKHFTLNRAMKGTDQNYSLEPLGLEKMVRDLSRVREAMGSGDKVIQLSELSAKHKMGKSVYAKVYIPKGSIISPEMIAFKSPCVFGGILPYEVDGILGKVALEDIAVDTPFNYLIIGSERVKVFGKIDWGLFLGE